MSESSENSNLDDISESSSLLDAALNVEKDELQVPEGHTSASKGSRTSLETDDSSEKYARKSSDTSAQSFTSFCSDQPKPDSSESLQKNLSERVEDEAGTDIDEFSSSKATSGEPTQKKNEDYDVATCMSKNPHECQGRHSHSEVSRELESASERSLSVSRPTSISKDHTAVETCDETSAFNTTEFPTKEVKMSGETQNSEITIAESELATQPRPEGGDSVDRDVDDIKAPHEKAFKQLRLKAHGNVGSVSESSLPATVTPSIIVEGDDEALSISTVQSSECTDSTRLDVKNQKGKRKRSVESPNGMIEHSESTRSLDDAMDTTEECPVSSDLKGTEEELSRFHIQTTAEVPNASQVEPNISPEQVSTGGCTDVELADMETVNDDNENATSDTAVFEQLSKRKRTGSVSNEEKQEEKSVSSHSSGPRSCNGKDRALVDTPGGVAVDSDLPSSCMAKNQEPGDAKQKETPPSEKQSPEDGRELVVDGRSAEQRGSSNYMAYQERIRRKYGIDVVSDSSTGTDSNIYIPTTNVSSDSCAPTQSHTSTTSVPMSDSKSSGKGSMEDSGTQSSSESTRSATTSEGRELDHRNTWLAQAGGGPRVTEEVVPSQLDPLPAVSDESAMIEEVSYRGSVRRASTLNLIEELPEDMECVPTGPSSELSVGESRNRYDFRKDKSLSLISRDSSTIEDSSSSGALKYDASSESLSSHQAKVTSSGEYSNQTTDEPSKALDTETNSNQVSPDSTLVTTEKTEDYCEPTVQSDISELDEDGESSLSLESDLEKNTPPTDKSVPLAVEESSDFETSETTPSSGEKLPPIHKQSPDYSRIPSRSTDDTRSTPSTSKTETPSLASEAIGEKNEIEGAKTVATSATKNSLQGSLNPVAATQKTEDLLKHPKIVSPIPEVPQEEIQEQTVTSNVITLREEIDQNPSCQGNISGDKTAGDFKADTPEDPSVALSEENQKQDTSNTVPNASTVSGEVEQEMSDSIAKIE